MIEEIQKVETINNFYEQGLTAKFTAWSIHCSKFYDELVSLIVDAKMILVENIQKANSLITDIQMLSQKVPFDGQLVDMSNDLYHWISLSVRGHVLKDFFKPIDT